MSKITIKSKKNETTITNKLTDGEQINQQMLKAIAEGSIEGLIPLTERSALNGTKLECCVSGKTLLSEKYHGIVPKKAFISAVLEIIGIIRRCKSYDSNAYENFYLTADSVFSDDATRKICLVYWPVSNNRNVTPITDFFVELPEMLMLSPNEDKRYLDTYMSFFSGEEPFDIDRFEKAMTEESEKDAEEEQLTTLLFNNDNDNASTGGLRFIDSTTVLYKVGEDSSDNEHFISEDDIATVDLNSDTGFMSRRYLVRMKSGERVEITSENFLIGKDMRYCDYTVTDNSAVSRQHAKIIRKDDSDYVIDLKSTNKTYVNGQLIPVEREVQIFSGARLKFANEEFIFYLEY